MKSCSVYNQVRGFKTRHSAGVGGNLGMNTNSSGSNTSGTTRMPADFEGYRLATGGSGRSSLSSNDSNQPTITALVNRVS